MKRIRQYDVDELSKSSGTVTGIDAAIYGWHYEAEAMLKGNRDDVAMISPYRYAVLMDDAEPCWHGRKERGYHAKRCYGPHEEPPRIIKHKDTMILRRKKRYFIKHKQKDH